MLILPPNFVAQARTFRLRCSCEDCTYFIASSEACAHGYPNAMHRLSAIANAPARAVTDANSGDNVGGLERYAAFCKEFELA